MNGYDEELEGYVTERTYFVPDNDGIELYSSESGSGWFKNEKSYRGWSPNPGNKATTYYAKGYFTWGTEGATFPTGPVGMIGCL